MDNSLSTFMHRCAEDPNRENICCLGQLPSMFRLTEGTVSSIISQEKDTVRQEKKAWGKLSQGRTNFDSPAFPVFRSFQLEVLLEKREVPLHEVSSHMRSLYP